MNKLYNNLKNLSVVIISNDNIKELDKKIELSYSQLNIIKEKDNRIKELEDIIKYQLDIFKEKDNKINELTNNINTNKSIIISLKTELKQKDDIISIQDIKLETEKSLLATYKNKIRILKRVDDKIRDLMSK